jgi:hypothetical protein
VIERLAPVYAQVDHDLGVVILPLGVELALAGKTAARAAETRSPAAHAAEERFEEVAELPRVRSLGAGARELEAGVPVGGRTEILPLPPVGAELVVGCALLRVLQDLVGLARVLELGFRARLLVDVGVVGAREFAVGALDVVLAGISLDAEDLVIVLIFHGDGGPETGGG